MTLSLIYWSSFVALLATKAADVVSTIRWVPPNAETNPWARRLFGRFGFKTGLLIVSAVFLVIVVAQYAAVWWSGPAWMQSLNAALGFAISWFNWVVARCNATGTHSRVRALAMRCYQCWGRWWRR